MRKIKIKIIVRREDMWGSGGTLPLFTTSSLDGGEWSVLRPGRFKPGNELRNPLSMKLYKPQESA
jgi:hypothetical protein